MAHKTGFSPKSLKASLLNAGFKSTAMVARDDQNYMDIWAIATKNIATKDELMEVAKQHLPMTVQEEASRD